MTLIGISHAEMKQCDMLERNAFSIYGASPPVNYLLYALDPALMAGLNFPLRQHEASYMPAAAKLPVIGGWFGQGRTPNLEVLAKVRPELTVAWNYRGNFGRIANTLETLGLEACALRLDRLEDYPPALRTLGRLTRHEARAERLAEDFERRLQRAEALRSAHHDDVPPRVYYAEGAGGLKTECAGSVHAELIERAGGVNVHRCESKSGYGMEQISFEQLLLYNPDVIIVFEPSFYERLFEDRRFARLDAVRAGRVHLIPRSPVNWFDRPPSFMRVAGLEWLQQVLWPAPSDAKLLASLQDFFALYFNREMGAEEIRTLLKPSAVQK